MTSKKTVITKVVTKVAAPKVAKPTIKSLQADIAQYNELVTSQANRLIEREAEIIVLRDEVTYLQKQVDMWQVSYNNQYKELQELRTRNWYQRLFNIKGA